MGHRLHEVSSSLSFFVFDDLNFLSIYVARKLVSVSIVVVSQELEVYIFLLEQVILSLLLPSHLSLTLVPIGIKLGSSLVTHPHGRPEHILLEDILTIVKAHFAMVVLQLHNYHLV